eukprot:tig00020943_g16269.t1
MYEWDGDYEVAEDWTEELPRMFSTINQDPVFTAVIDDNDEDPDGDDFKYEYETDETIQPWHIFLTIVKRVQLQKKAVSKWRSRVQAGALARKRTGGEDEAAARPAAAGHDGEHLVNAVRAELQLFDHVFRERVGLGVPADAEPLDEEGAPGGEPGETSAGEASGGEGPASSGPHDKTPSPTGQGRRTPGQRGAAASPGPGPEGGPSGPRKKSLGTGQANGDAPPTGFAERVIGKILIAMKKQLATVDIDFERHQSDPQMVAPAPAPALAPGAAGAGAGAGAGPGLAPSAPLERNPEDDRRPSDGRRGSKQLLRMLKQTFDATLEQEQEAAREMFTGPRTPGTSMAAPSSTPMNAPTNVRRRSLVPSLPSFTEHEKRSPSNSGKGLSLPVPPVRPKTGPRITFAPSPDINLLPPAGPSEEPVTPPLPIPTAGSLDLPPLPLNLELNLPNLPPPPAIEDLIPMAQIQTQLPAVQSFLISVRNTLPPVPVADVKFDDDNYEKEQSHGSGARAPEAAALPLPRAPSIPATPSLAARPPSLNRLPSGLSIGGSALLRPYIPGAQAPPLVDDPDWQQVDSDGEGSSSGGEGAGGAGAGEGDGDAGTLSDGLNDFARVSFINPSTRRSRRRGPSPGASFRSVASGVALFGASLGVDAGEEREAPWRESARRGEAPPHAPLRAGAAPPALSRQASSIANTLLSASFYGPSGSAPAPAAGDEAAAGGGAGGALERAPSFWAPTISVEEDALAPFRVAATAAVAASLLAAGPPPAPGPRRRRRLVGERRGGSGTEQEAGNGAPSLALTPIPEAPTPAATSVASHRRARRSRRRRSSVESAASATTAPSAATSGRSLGFSAYSSAAYSFPRSSLASIVPPSPPESEGDGGTEDEAPGPELHAPVPPTEASSPSPATAAASTGMPVPPSVLDPTSPSDLSPVSTPRSSPAPSEPPETGHAGAEPEKARAAALAAALSAPAAPVAPEAAAPVAPEAAVAAPPLEPGPSSLAPKLEPGAEPEAEPEPSEEPLAWPLAPSASFPAYVLRDPGAPARAAPAGRLADASERAARAADEVALLRRAAALRGRSGRAGERAHLAPLAPPAPVAPPSLPRGAAAAAEAPGGHVLPFESPRAPQGPRRAPGGGPGTSARGRRRGPSGRPGASAGAALPVPPEPKEALPEAEAPLSPPAAGPCAAARPPTPSTPPHRQPPESPKGAEPAAPPAPLPLYRLSSSASGAPREAPSHPPLPHAESERGVRWTSPARAYYGEGSVSHRKLAPAPPPRPPQRARPAPPPTRPARPRRPRPGPRRAVPADGAGDPRLVGPAAAPGLALAAPLPAASSSPLAKLLASAGMYPGAPAGRRHPPRLKRPPGPHKPVLAVVAAAGEAAPLSAAAASPPRFSAAGAPASSAHLPFPTPRVSVFVD